MPSSLDLSAIRKELAASERRTAVLRAFLKEFGGGSSVVLGTAGQDPVRSPWIRKKERIVAVVREMLADGATATKSEILRECLRRGVLGEQQKPNNRLGTVLWEESGEFESDGRGTYRLRVQPEAAQAVPPGSAGVHENDLNGDLAAQADESSPATSEKFALPISLDDRVSDRTASAWEPSQVEESSACDTLLSDLAMTSVGRQPTAQIRISGTAFEDSSVAGNKVFGRSPDLVGGSRVSGHVDGNGLRRSP